MTAGVDGGGKTTLGVWQALVPADGTNLVTNPSFETGTTGYTQTSATLTQTAGAGVFGAYGGRLLASATNGKTSFTAASVSSGTAVVASAWVKSSSALVTLKLTIGASNGSVAHPGDGAWHRLEVPITAPSTTTPVLEFIDGRSSAWTNVDIDGVMIETGVTAASTYIDGDQDGCSWTGTLHGSTSTRDGRDGRGGTITTIDQPGATGSYVVRESRGTGVPEITVATTELALADGAVYQRSRGQSRTLSLLYTIFGDGTLSGLHTSRRSLLSILNPDLRSGRGPITLRYIGSSSPRLLQAYYQSGLEGGEIKATYEEPEVKFLAPDPIWQSETEESSSLTVNQTLSPVNNLALRNADGSWSSLAGGPTANIQNALGAFLQLADGRFLIGGANMQNLGGNAAIDYLGAWDGSTWANLGTAPNSDIYAGAFGNDGLPYLGGAFTSIGGSSINRIAVGDSIGSTWSSVGTGGASAAVDSLAIDPTTGYLWATTGSNGSPTFGGVSTGGIAYWNGSTWTNASGGLPASWTVPTGCLIAGPDGRMYLGIFSISGPAIYVWTGSAWTSFAALGGSVPTPRAMLSSRGRLYIGGTFTSIGGVSVSNIAVSNGTGWSSMAGGIVGSTVYSLAAAADGTIFAAGQNWTSVGGITPTDAVASWNGSSWNPLGFNPPDTGTHANDNYFVRSARNGAVMVNWTASSGTFGTSMTVEAITTVTNNGTANAYPVIEISGAGTVYEIANLTTGQRITFSGCTLASGETARLDLRPGRWTFGTLVRSLISTVLSPSNLATFYLAPGANRIAMMASGGTAVMHWRDRYWSAD